MQQHAMILHLIFVQLLMVTAVAAAEGGPEVSGLIPAYRAMSQGVDMNEHWKTETLIERQGYHTELHSVLTRDGYRLTVQRIPQPGQQPVLLVHGLYGSATDFVIMGSNFSLAFALADQKYDVWLANCRGSNSSQSHLELSVEELFFWNFSFHEMGIYDLPAIVDYIRVNSSFHQLHFVGHGQGATALLVMAAMRPDYNDKIGLAQLMAPLCHMQHLHVDGTYMEYIKEFLQDPTSRQIHEFLPRGFLRQHNCLQNKFQKLSCLQMIFQLIGPDLAQFNQTITDLLFSQWPAGGSVKQLRHLYQIFEAATFQQYDYGFEGNYDRYAAPTPPKYNLSRITLPIVLHYGPNDFLAPSGAVKLLSTQLPHVLGLYAVPFKQFNHLDFIWAKQLDVLLNARLLQIFDDFARNVLKANVTV